MLHLLIALVTFKKVQTHHISVAYEQVFTRFPTKPDFNFNFLNSSSMTRELSFRTTLRSLIISKL